MHPAFLQEIVPHFLVGSALEQHVVGHHHRGAAVDL
jgi:hypothetical protein